MATKNKKEEPITSTGCIEFNGTLTLKLKGKEYQVRCEYHGLDLQRASQEHKLVMLIKPHLPYDEIDVGYLVRTKDLDKNHQFGLKVEKADRWFSIYDYNDVIAWGYADGGLNSNHFDSCRLRPEDYPQFAGEPDESKFVQKFVHEDDEFYDEDYKNRKFVRFRVGKEGKINYSAFISTDENMERGGTKLMHDCAKAFTDLRKEHPEVTEMHFYTADEL